jgi:hypothetical protein
MNRTFTRFIRGILRGVRYAKSLRVLFLHRRSPSWTTLVLYSRAVFIFNEPTTSLVQHKKAEMYAGQRRWAPPFKKVSFFYNLIFFIYQNFTMLVRRVAIQTKVFRLNGDVKL